MTSRWPRIDGAFLRSAPLPDPPPGATKDERGTILIVGGARETPGAVLLAGIAALRAGAGKIQVATVASAATGLALALPEARVLALLETPEGDIDPVSASALRRCAEKAHAIVVGPGMIDDDGARRIALALFEMNGDARFLIDAAALTGLRAEGHALRALGGRVAITPHAGEMATFLGREKQAVCDDPADAAGQAANVTGGAVAMKGGDTLVVEAGGSPRLCEGGGIGLATSGSGDVLAGLVGGFLARGAPPLLALQWGTFVHAEAGRRLTKSVGRLGFLAREIADMVPAILDDFGPDARAVEA
ncbi:NAD(P)H-hydrate dehydratase [Antarcticirhabdus aurantiaca]|uniref:NAD(P)H-hydrate dehydratase n=1 Tax=Antarcticirhabdus aurantiaca TaxID=2606717 RepID=A0ACD4NJP0_9HYPH|nr:NAD(P)H-hydrate dehydratase [Antarcticirhabdus aurantiaca]WAJ27020.1 NAD(P)H-hydrate dehydratase [Jeongeuplla avenae]